MPVVYKENDIVEIYKCHRGLCVNCEPRYSCPFVKRVRRMDGHLTKRAGPFLAEIADVDNYAGVKIRRLETITEKWTSPDYVRPAKFYMHKQRLLKPV